MSNQSNLPPTTIEDCLQAFTVISGLGKPLSLEKRVGEILTEKEAPGEIPQTPKEREVLEQAHQSPE
jgi:hypothetical protein